MVEKGVLFVFAFFSFFFLQFASVLRTFFSKSQFICVYKSYRIILNDKVLEFFSQLL